MENHEEAVKIAAEALFEAGVYGSADRCVFIPQKQYDALKLALDRDEKWGEGLVNGIIQDVCDMIPDADPDDSDTIVISVHDLQLILERHIRGVE